MRGPSRLKSNRIKWLTGCALKRSKEARNAAEPRPFPPVTLRTLTLMLALLLGACAGIAYGPERGAADIPAGVDAIRLAELSPVSLLTTADNVQENVDLSPSENDREMLAAARVNLIKAFAAAGIAVVEDDSRPTTVGMRVYIAYQPERWPLVLRSVSVFVRVFDADDQFLFRDARGKGSFTVVQSMVQTRDDFVADVIDSVTEDAVAELRKGTKPAIAKLRPGAQPHPVAGAAPPPTLAATAPPGAVTTPPAPPAGAPAVPVVHREGYEGRWQVQGERQPGGLIAGYFCSGYSVELDVVGDRLEAILPAGRSTTRVVATVAPDGHFHSTTGDFGVSVTGQFRGETVDLVFSSGNCPSTPGKGRRVS